jgi:hypothetical protein
MRHREEEAMTHRRSKKPPPRVPVTGYCDDCGKLRYMSRAEARKAATRQSRRMRVYRCPDNDEFWHTTSWGPATRVEWYRERDQ